MQKILNSLVKIATNKIKEGEDVGGSGFANIKVAGNFIACEVRPYGGSTNRNHYKKLFYKNGRQVSYKSLTD